MNKLFLKVGAIVLGAGLVVGSGVAIAAYKESFKAADAETAYIKETSSIAAGDTIVLVNEDAKKELSGVTTTGTTIGSVVDYTTVPVGAYALTVEAGSSSGTFALKNGSDYLSWSSGNSLAKSATKNAASSWNVSFSNGNAVIANSGTSSRKLQYNSGSPRFACYTSTQAAVQIYKLTTVQEGAVTGVSLDKSFEIIKTNGSLTLTETIVPSNATNKSVNWSSSNTSVATVAGGVVTPHSKGNTTITVTTVDGGFTATCDVVVADHLGTAADPLTASDAILVADATGSTATSSRYYVTGTVTAVSYSSGQATATITDGASSFSVFKFYDEGTDSSSKFTDETKIIVTDTIVVWSVIVKYNNSTPQAQYGNLYSVTRNVTLTSVEIRGNITAAQYVNENWNIDELSVYAIYSNNDEIDVTTTATIVCNPVKPTSTGAQSFTVDAAYNSVNATQREFNVTVIAQAPTTSDVITSDLLVATSTQYKDFSDVDVTSKAIYAGNTAKTSSGGVQLRTTNSNAGIISTRSGGKRVKSVSIVVETGNPNIQVYGSNTAYSGTDASILYGGSQGTLVATLTSSSTSIAFASDYKYVGVRSASGAAYLTSITIVWEQYTAETIATEIKEMAGGWNNNVSTANCYSNYASAKGMILTLANTELNTFQNSTDTEIASARATYETWCDRNNDANPYSGNIVSSSNRLGGIIKLNGNNITIFVLVSISISAISAVALVFVLKRKKHN